MLRKRVGLVKAEATTTKHQRRVCFSCRSVICDELRRNRADLAHSLLRRFIGRRWIAAAWDHICRLRAGDDVAVYRRVVDGWYLVVGLPPVPDFPGCSGFSPCCPASRQDQPRDAKCPDFKMQPKPKMPTTIIITITIIGVIVLI